MAKWGEGDPRWQVTELGENGRNVNAWHWEDKNYSKWAHQHIKDTWKDVVLTENPIKLTIKEVDKISGDVEFLQRKGKSMYLYDLCMKLKFSGEKVEGTLELTDVDSLQNVTDFEFQLNITTNTSDISTKDLRDAIKAEGLTNIHRQFAKFLTEFQEHHGATGVKTPIVNATIGSSGSRPNLLAQQVELKSDQKSKREHDREDEEASNVKRKKVVSNLEFNGPIREIFECLTDAQRLSCYTQSQATFDRVVGGKVRLFGDSITGEITEINPPTKVVMNWRNKDWPKDVVSVVTLTFEDLGNSKTKLSLSHVGVPEDDLSRTIDGWRSRFWERIQMVFGFQFKKL